MISFLLFPKTLLIGSLIFFIFFFFLCTIWAKDFHPERNLIIGFLVSVFYTFWIVAIGFIFLILIYFLIG